MQILDFNLRRIHITNLIWGNEGEPENITDPEDKVKIIQLADMCQGCGIRVEDTKGRVRPEIPPVVELRGLQFGACADI